MNIPIEIIAAVLPQSFRPSGPASIACGNGSSGTEKHVLILIIMLRDGGFEIPNETDTRTFLKANNL